MIENIIEKLENLEFDDDFFTDNELLLSALGLTLGPTGFAVITAIKKANELNSITNNLISVIKKVCDDPDVNINNLYFKNELNQTVSNDTEKEILNKISQSIDLKLIDIPTDERWA